MLTIRKTEKKKLIITTIGVKTIFGFVLQVINYILSILAIIFKINNDFYLSTVVPILICNLVIPAGLTLLLMVIYTFLMIFMYFKGKFDKLKIEIIDIDRNGNEDSSIYSPFKMFIIIIMGIGYFSIILSPIFAGLFIWCCTKFNQPHNIPRSDTLFLFFTAVLSSFSAVSFVVFVFSILGILCGCCNCKMRSRTLVIPVYTNDPNNIYFVKV